MVIVFIFSDQAGLGLNVAYYYLQFSIGEQINRGTIKANYMLKRGQQPWLPQTDQENVFTANKKLNFGSFWKQHPNQIIVTIGFYWQICTAIISPWFEGSKYLAKYFRMQLHKLLVLNVLVLHLGRAELYGFVQYVQYARASFPLQRDHPQTMSPLRDGGFPQKGT